MKNRPPRLADLWKRRLRWWTAIGICLMLCGGLIALEGLVLAGMAVVYGLRGALWPQTVILLLQSSCLFGGLCLIVGGKWFAERRFRRAIVIAIFAYLYMVGVHFGANWLGRLWGLE